MPDLATGVTGAAGAARGLDVESQPDQADNVNKTPYPQAVRQESMRIGYLSIDAAGRSARTTH